MSYLEEILPEFRKGAKIRRKNWDKDRYIYLNHCFIFSKEDGCEYLLGPHIMANDWELYQEPIDWDYIIKNKCLCWFWDEDEKYGKFSRLVKIREKEFVTSNENGFCIMFKNCRPVRRDEVTFYEDRKDNFDE